MDPRPDPSFAVVIPVYNGEAYVAQAIDSALAQARPPLEIVVVDDGSTDRTAAVLEQYREEPRVRCARLPLRVPAAAAWNIGVRESRADYVVVLGHDDRLHGGFLAAVAAAVASAPDVGLFVSGYRLIDSLGRLIEERPIRASRLLGRIPFDVFFHELVILGTIYYQPSSCVIRRADFDRVGGFDPRFHAIYDYDFFIRLAAATPTLGLAGMLVDYRTHPTNTSAAVYYDGGADADVLFGKIASYAGLSESQKRDLAVNISQFQFHYLTRTLRRPGVDCSHVRAVRSGIRERLAGWQRMQTPYSGCVDSEPQRLRQWMAWRLSGTRVGISAMQAALRWAAARPQKKNAARGRARAALQG